ncbi:MAG: MFS transporter [Bifidobacteriaceae bacterium]|nr:MFS transporter [Bifidobacteriaceae bacterium]
MARTAKLVGVIGAELRGLWRSPQWRRLIGLRAVGQAGDGIFQAGLAFLFFFTPENALTPAGVALGFGVLLGPFTLVGPWAGVLLDRWRRRSVLVVGSLAKAGLALLAGLVVAADAASPAIYVLALTCLSVNRFVLASLGAVLPKTVPPPALLTANAITPTIGTISAGVGAVMGLGLAGWTGQAGRPVVVALAGLAFLGAGLVARGFPAGLLGPEAPVESVKAAFRALAHGLAGAARYLVRRRTPAAALGVMALTRLAYGLLFMASILMSRNLLSDPSKSSDDLAVFGQILTCTGVGFGLAVVVTPLAHQRLSPRVWITCCLGLAVAAQAALACTYARPVLLAGAGLLGLASQGTKIAVDTMVQRDTADRFRGRAFALYDVAYNAAFILAAVLGAALLPVGGYSTAAFLGLAAFYLAILALHLAAPATPRPIPGVAAAN